MQYYYRYDISFQGRNSSVQSSQSSRGGSSKSSPSSLHALAIHHDVNKENIWFLDSGATNHVTSDMANLNFGAEYQGDNKVLVGNGTGLDVKHI